MKSIWYILLLGSQLGIATSSLAWPTAVLEDSGGGVTNCGIERSRENLKPRCLSALGLDYESQLYMDYDFHRISSRKNWKGERSCSYHARVTCRLSSSEINRRERIAREQDRIKRLQGEVSRLRKTDRELVGKLKEAESILAEAEKENKRAKDLVAQSGTKLETSRAYKRYLAGQKKDLKSDLEKVSQEKTAAFDRYKSLEQQNDQELSRHQQKIADMKHDDLLSRSEERARSWQFSTKLPVISEASDKVLNSVHLWKIEFDSEHFEPVNVSKSEFSREEWFSAPEAAPKKRDFLYAPQTGVNNRDGGYITASDSWTDLEKLGLIAPGVVDQLIASEGLWIADVDVYRVKNSVEIVLMWRNGYPKEERN